MPIPTFSGMLDVWNYSFFLRSRSYSLCIDKGVGTIQLINFVHLFNHELILNIAIVLFTTNNKWQLAGMDIAKKITTSVKSVKGFIVFLPLRKSSFIQSAQRIFTKIKRG